MKIEDIRSEAARIQWFHNFELAPGVMTGGPSSMSERAPYFQIPQDLTGKRVLDVGCADGYFTFLAEKRGATVVSIDAWPRRGFFFAREVLASKAEFHHMSVYDISPDQLGMFDIVFFFGVYYHLKHPMLALERIAGVTREFALIESESMAPFTPQGESLARFYEHDELGGDPTNWWVPSIPCLLQTVRSAGFAYAEFVTCYHTRRGIVRAYKGPRTAGKPLTEDYFIAIDTPAANAVVSGRVTISGWALSQLEPHGGIERVVAYLDHLDDPACELGQAQYGSWRQDLTEHFGDDYGSIGFRLDWDAMRVAEGQHILHVLAEGRRGWHYRSMPIIVSKSRYCSTKYPALAQDTSGEAQMNTTDQSGVAELIPIEGMDNATVRASLHSLAADMGARFKIYVDNDEHDEITEAIVKHKYTFPPGFSLLCELVETGRRVLDVGAHIGTFSLFAAAAGYQVIAVEASPYNATLLKKSVDQNGFKTIQVVSAAVSDHAGMLEFVPNGPYGFVSNPVLDGPTVSVPAITLDDLLDRFGWGQVDWIKLDIEGSEVAAVQGMSRLLSRHGAPSILYESNGHALHLFGRTPSELMALLEGFGYQCYLVKPGRLVPVKSGELQPEVNVDYLATKHTPDVSGNWQIAPPMSFEERMTKILATSTHPNEFIRAYIARALSSADSEILADLRVINALRTLKADPNGNVRAATSWWQDQLWNTELQQLRHWLALKDAENTRLEELVRGYEHGRFIRAMKALRQLWHSVMRTG